MGDATGHFFLQLPLLSITTIHFARGKPNPLKYEVPKLPLRTDLVAPRPCFRLRPMSYAGKEALRLPPLQGPSARRPKRTANQQSDPQNHNHGPARKQVARREGSPDSDMLAAEMARTLHVGRPTSLAGAAAHHLGRTLRTSAPRHAHRHVRPEDVEQPVLY